MKIKSGIYALAVVIAFNSIVNGQEQQGTKDTQTQTNPKAKRFALGFELNEFQSDFGLGATITSPYFCRGVMAVRLHGGVSWLTGIRQGETEYTSMYYNPIRLGYAVSVGMLGGYSRFYSEAGGILLVPGEEISDDIALGGYGLFGFEFFTTIKSPVTYFIEAGGVGSGGYADKLSGKPAYANGFIIDVGIRWYL